ncbi:MAG: NUDIX domain-containing protein [Haliea sp.]|jgi:ADP-ribose pyrophosphatase YjhB (NUDIX family)|nr:NUDIX domain-containing protein [Haliea sp.]
MSEWPPHVTVASVIIQDGLYLLVEERDKYSGALVFNQPAGHLEPGESLVEAAMRETLEETGWQVEIIGILGMALYSAPGNGLTYYRTTFLGKPLSVLDDYRTDPDIHAVHWMDYEEIRAKGGRMRSPLVLSSIEQHRRGVCCPLDLIYG